MADGDRDKWDARHRAQAQRAREAHPFLLECAALLPFRGRALDVAGGTGRHALWLARRGLDVTLADVSGVALAMARAQAAIDGLAIQTLAIDLEQEPLPAGPWSLIVCVDFLWRPLFEAFPAALRPGGVLLIAHPTRSNLERHPSPSARFLLDDGELPGLVAGLTVLRYEEAWTPWGRHEARMIAVCTSLG